MLSALLQGQSIDFPESPATLKPDGSGTRVTDAAEQILDGVNPTRIDMVYLHNHYDPIGTATILFNYMKGKFPRAKFFIWGSAEARRSIERSVSKRAPVPNINVGTRIRTLTLGKGLKLQMRIVNGHAFGDLLLYIPKYKSQASVAMYVDLIFPRWSPFSNLALTEDVWGYIDAHDEILKLDFDFFVGGHLLIGRRVDVIRNQRFAKDLVAAGIKGTRGAGIEEFAQAGIGKGFDASSPEFGNVWYIAVEVVRKAQKDNLLSPNGGEVGVSTVWAPTDLGISLLHSRDVRTD